MILRGQTSPRLGWTTTLGVFGLAVLLLPLVPGFGAAQRPVAVPPSTVSLGQFDDEERERLQAEIDALIGKRYEEAQQRKARADIALRDQRRALNMAWTQNVRAQEIQALKAEIAAKMATLKELEAKPGAAKNPTRDSVAAQDTSQVVTIQIEVSGVKSSSELRALTEHLKRAVPGNLKLKSIRGGAPSSLAMGTPPPHVVLPPDDTGHPPADNVKTRLRIDALEMKLDAVLKELEALRKSKAAPSKDPRRPGRPGAGGPSPEDPFQRTPASGPPGPGTAPLPTPAAPDSADPTSSRSAAPGKTTAPLPPPAAPGRSAAPAPGIRP